MAPIPLFVAGMFAGYALDAALQHQWLIASVWLAESAVLISLSSSPPKRRA